MQFIAGAVHLTEKNQFKKGMKNFLKFFIVVQVFELFI